MNKLVLDIETYQKPKPIDIGLFEEDDETFYIIFDPKHGDMEFSSVDALSEYLTPTNGGKKSREAAMIKSIVKYKSGFNWVTDNDPVELDYIRWIEMADGSVHGKYVIRTTV